VLLFTHLPQQLYFGVIKANGRDLSTESRGQDKTSPFGFVFLVDKKYLHLFASFIPLLSLEGYWNDTYFKLHNCLVDQKDESEVLKLKLQYLTSTQR
jgi:hypothetical protein